MDVTFLIDHGKGFFWATLVVFICWKEDNEWNEKEESFSLASARCRKENKKVIVNTYGTRLNKLMKIIKEVGCVSISSVIMKDDNGKQVEYIRIGQMETNE